MPTTTQLVSSPVNTTLIDIASGFTVHVSDPNHTLTASQLSLLTLDARYAANDWMSRLNNKGVIDIEINLQKPVSGHPADGGPAAHVQVGTETIDVPVGPLNQHMAWNVMRPGTISEMLTGKDPNGADPDIIINIDPDTVKTGYLNPHPSQTRYDGPVGQSDVISTLLHEIGHGLGIGDGYRDPNTGQLPATVTGAPGGIAINYTETVWDKLVTFKADGTAFFAGVNAFLADGNFFPAVTTLKNGEQYFHFGNDLRDVRNGGGDLMTGVGLFKGIAYEVTDLDLAVMKDLGASVKSLQLIGFLHDQPDHLFSLS